MSESNAYRFVSVVNHTAINHHCAIRDQLDNENVANEFEDCIKEEDSWSYFEHRVEHHEGTCEVFQSATCVHIVYFCINDNGTLIQVFHQMLFILIFLFIFLVIVIILIIRCCFFFLLHFICRFLIFLLIFVLVGLFSALILNRQVVHDFTGFMFIFLHFDLEFSRNHFLIVRLDDLNLLLRSILELNFEVQIAKDTNDGNNIGK